MNKIGIISLGCDKNRVDTENMLSYLAADGYVFTGDPADADIIIVNTCAFIESARREALDTIFDMSDYKNNGKCKCLVVTGCLPQRYMSELKNELGEADILLGTASYSDLPRLLKEFKGQLISKENDKDYRNFTTSRYLTTPYHYAYLKIAEGCDNKCTYCAIPAIRGKYTSRKMEDILDEARGLIREYGVKELILVAQDTTRYGTDIYGEGKIVELIRLLSKEDIRWIRLLYCYPELVTDELLTEMTTNDKVVKYIDIPMQHASSAVLKRMNRRVDRQQLQSLVDKIRKTCPDMALRSTFIVGFPGETEEQYQEIYEFCQKNRIDKCGFFAYSQEEGTPAARLPQQLDEDIKQHRLAKLYALQEGIMAEKAVEMVGKVCQVVYEDIDYDNDRFIGRMSTDCPDVDRVVYMTASKPLDIGEIYTVKICGVEGIDLIGEIE